MSNNILRFSSRRLAVAVVIAFWQMSSGQFALASSAPRITGTYTVVERTSHGAEDQVRVRIHLVNQGSTGWSIQRMALWDSGRRGKGASRVCTMALGARGSADPTQEFLVRRTDYQRWKRGTRPRLMLEVVGPDNTQTRTMVELDRMTGQEAR